MDVRYHIIPARTNDVIGRKKCATGGGNRFGLFRIQGRHFLNFFMDFLPKLRWLNNFHISAELQNLHFHLAKIRNRKGQLQAAVGKIRDFLGRVPQLLANPARPERGEPQGDFYRVGTLENAECFFQKRAPGFTGAARECPGKQLWSLHPGKIEFSPVVLAMTPGDQYPTGHVILKMVGLDLAPGGLICFGGGVGKGKDAGIHQSVYDSLENVRMDRRIAMPDRGKGFRKDGSGQIAAMGIRQKLLAEATQIFCDQAAVVF